MAVVFLLCACGGADNPPPNAEPQGAGEAVVTDEDTVLVKTLSATDADGDPLVINITNDVDHGVLTLGLVVQGGFDASYIPDTDYNGDDVFAFTVSDGQSTAGPFTVTITINPVNDAPSVSNATTSVDEDSVVSDTVIGSDVEGDPLRFSLISNPPNGAVNFSTDGGYTYTPHENFEGMDEFTFLANDGSLDSNVATTTIEVTGTDDPPVANDDTFTVAEGAQLRISPEDLLANDSDPDGDVVTLDISSMSSPSRGVLDSTSNGDFVYTSVPNNIYADTFNYRVWDGTTLSSQAKVTIRTLPVNDAPHAESMSISTRVNSPVVVTLKGCDEDFADLLRVTYAVAREPINGTLSGLASAPDPGPHFNPINNYQYGAFGAIFPEGSGVPSTMRGCWTAFGWLTDVGILDFPSYLNGGLMLSFFMAPGSVGSTIFDSNSSGSFDSISPLLDNPSVTSITVTGKPDPDVLSLNRFAIPRSFYTFSSMPENPIVPLVRQTSTKGIYTPSPFSPSPPGAAVTYTPDPDFIGTDSFTFHTSDGELESNEATIAISVRPEYEVGTFDITSPHNSCLVAVLSPGVECEVFASRYRDARESRIKIDVQESRVTFSMVSMWNDYRVILGPTDFDITVKGLFGSSGDPNVPIDSINVTIEEFNSDPDDPNTGTLDATKTGDNEISLHFGNWRAEICDWQNRLPEGGLLCGRVTVDITR